MVVAIILGILGYKIGYKIFNIRYTSLHGAEYDIIGAKSKTITGVIVGLLCFIFGLVLFIITSLFVPMKQVHVNEESISSVTITTEYVINYHNNGVESNKVCYVDNDGRIKTIYNKYTYYPDIILDSNYTGDPVYYELVRYHENTIARLITYPFTESREYIIKLNPDQLNVNYLGGK